MDWPDNSYPPVDLPQVVGRLNQFHYADEVNYYSVASIRSIEVALVNDLSKELPSGSVLDAGCGAGRFLRLLKDSQFQCKGLDISPGAVAKANEIVPDAFPEVGDVRCLPFSDNSFDVVFCMRYAINALPTPECMELAINEFLRVLRPGGILFIEYFNRWRLGRFGGMLAANYIEEISRSVRRGIGQPGALPPHCYFYLSNKSSTALPGFLRLHSHKEIREILTRSIGRHGLQSAAVARNHKPLQWLPISRSLLAPGFILRIQTRE